MAKISKRFSVALDIKRAVSNRAFEVVEGDNGNIISVTLTDDGEAVDLTGCRLLAVFSKQYTKQCKRCSEDHKKRRGRGRQPDERELWRQNNRH
ncbi:MAG TPA: hypothetical protein VN512_10580 [Clostridia bacterium]|nr:hypothetical protein [Clostridia bacterium]